MSLDPSPDRSGRAQSLLHSGLSLALLLLIAALAIPSRQNAPPAIAALAPQPQEQIIESFEEQTSDFGEGEGGASVDVPGDGGGVTEAPTSTTTTAPPAPPVTVPRLRRCVGDPPRQTEDPQSPPCVPFFEGDNGGATSKGVTADVIRVAAPANKGYSASIVAHFNLRYEFYGRRIEILPTGTSSDMVADAIRVDEELDAFASLVYTDKGGAENVFYDELARRGIVSVNSRPSFATEAQLAANHPYQWSYLPTFDVMSRNETDYVCRGLLGGPPRHASGAQLAADERVFGLVVTVNLDGSRPDMSTYEAGLRACGIDIPEDRRSEMTRQEGDDASGLAQAQAVVQKFQLAGVTTVLCVCHTQSSGLYLYTASSAQNYFPEWVVSTYLYQAEDSHATTWDPTQVDNSFGFVWYSKQLRAVDSPWFWAVKEGDPDAEFPSFFDYYEARYFYNSLLPLAAGIQAAGPNLTPETFAAGLQSLRFPNPGAGTAPYYQGTVDFRDDHSMIDDGALVWLSNEERSNWSEVSGAVCFANQGTRYQVGRWPASDADLFTGSCY